MKQASLSFLSKLPIAVVSCFLTLGLSLSVLPSQPSTAHASFENCSNSIDDDSDFLVDCQDAIDCAYASNCTEDCFNEIDDDGDGAVDCDDYYCAWSEPACA